LRHLTEFLGLAYRPLEVPAMHDPAQYCGTYAIQLDGQLHTLEIRFDGSSLYCRAFWPYMKLLPLGGDRFQMSAFPVRLTFLRDASTGAKAVRVRGTYDWEIMGKTLPMVTPSICK
jgi:hypothetical protein